MAICWFTERLSGCPRPPPRPWPTGIRWGVWWRHLSWSNRDRPSPASVYSGVTRGRCSLGGLCQDTVIVQTFLYITDLLESESTEICITEAEIWFLWKLVCFNNWHFLDEMFSFLQTKLWRWHWIEHPRNNIKVNKYVGSEKSLFPVHGSDSPAPSRDQQHLPHRHLLEQPGNRYDRAQSPSLVEFSLIFK